MSNREKYEQLILASPLFSLDKERDAIAYRREKLKMVTYLYNYLLSINEKRYVDYGLEINQTANHCIENFELNNGDFLHYFNAAWSKEYRRESAKRSIQEFRNGIHITDADDRIIRKIWKLMKARGIVHPTEEQLRIMADVLDISIEKVRNAILTINETSVVSDVTYDDLGNEISLFDTIDSEASTDDEMMSADACNEILQKVEDAFCVCQERQKAIISAMMTIKVCREVCDNRISVDKYSFVDIEILKNYILCGMVPTQREIADQFGKNEASVSRTLKEFLEKLRGKNYDKNSVKKSVVK